MLPVNTNESIKAIAEACNCIQTRIGQCSHYSNAAVGVSETILNTCLVLEVQGAKPALQQQ